MKNTNKKLDTKLQLIQDEINASIGHAAWVICRDIETEGKKYRNKGKLEFKRICVLRDQLYTASYNLTESEKDDIIELINERSFSDFKLLISIGESDNLQFKQIAGIMINFASDFLGVPNILSCYLGEFIEYYD